MTWDEEERIFKRDFVSPMDYTHSEPKNDSTASSPPQSQIWLHSLNLIKQQRQLESEKLVSDRALVTTTTPNVATTPNKMTPRKRKKTDDDQADVNTTFKTKPTKTKSSKLDHIHHLNLVYVIGGYIQLIFSIFILSVVLFVIIQFGITIKHDLDVKADEYSQEILHQVQECNKQYIQNRCDPKHRIPAITKLCIEWEVCMLRDPKEVGRLKVGAETFAEILNKLVEPLSYKTMIFAGFLLFGSLVVTTIAASFIKSKKNENSKQATSINHHFYGSHSMDILSNFNGGRPIHQQQSQHHTKKIGFFGDLNLGDKDKTIGKYRKGKVESDSEELSE